MNEWATGQGELWGVSGTEGSNSKDGHVKYGIKKRQELKRKQTYALENRMGASAEIICYHIDFVIGQWG
jgi:hypothetical protein